MQQNQFSRQSASQFGISNPSGLLNPAMSPTNPNLTIGDQFALMREMLPVNESLTRLELAQNRDRRAEEQAQFAKEQALIRNEQSQQRIEERAQERSEINDRRKLALTRELVANDLDPIDYLDENDNFNFESANQALGEADRMKALRNAELKQEELGLKAEEERARKAEEFNEALIDFENAGGSLREAREAGATDASSLNLLTARKKRSPEVDATLTSEAVDANIDAVLETEESGVLDWLLGNDRAQSTRGDLIRSAQTLTKEKFISKFADRAKGVSVGNKEDSLGQVYDELKGFSAAQSQAATQQQQQAQEQDQVKAQEEAQKRAGNLINLVANPTRIKGK